VHAADHAPRLLAPALGRLTDFAGLLDLAGFTGFVE
jgi:hypothetical protein